MNKKAILILEDQSYYTGYALGELNKKSFGEIVFNTGLTGYQEILTDPSYAGQMVTLTYPEIGNYGINESEDNQSRQIFAAGLIIKNFSPINSSWRGEEANLNDFLLKYNCNGLYRVDTRQITRKIRSQGAMKALISTEENCWQNDYLVKASQELAEFPSIGEKDLASVVTCPEPYFLNHQGTETKGLVVVLDFGLKINMLNLLTKRGYDLWVLPANASFEQIKNLKPNGIFLSNGPGDPAACLKAQETVKKLIDSGLAPIFGVCLGHQILALASGAKTFKLKFGHRGSNHPVKDLNNNKVYITSQNHGYAVLESSLNMDELRITHKSLNDETIEGFEYKNKPIFSVQFHPEACPGPEETSYLFDKFASLI
jgi:carbamoyl-phosphate synthase small subunit